MKKLVFTIIATLIGVAAFAKSSITLTGGDLKGINLEGKNILIKFDYKKCKIFDEDTKKIMTEKEFCAMKGKDWVRDLGKDHVAAEASFSQAFAHKNKSLNVVTSKKQANYTIVYHITLFCYGNPVSGMIAGSFAGKNAKGFAEGWFEVIDNKSGKTVARLEHKRIYGSNFATSWSQKREFVYISVSKTLAKYLAKIK